MCLVQVTLMRTYLLRYHHPPPFAYPLPTPFLKVEKNWLNTDSSLSLRLYSFFSYQHPSHL